MARMTSRTPRRGIETVEAALVFPFLLIITFGIVEYGWLFLKEHQLTNVTRQAARLAAMPDATAASVNAVITTMMQNAKISGYQTTYSPDISNPKVTATAGQPITVTIRVPYVHNLSLTNVTLIPLPGTLQAQVAMNKEGP